MMAITPTPDSEALPLDGRLWTFATGAYARAGVAEACIALQDEFDIDVALLLFTAWAGAEAGLTLSPDHLAAAAAGVSDWRDEIVAVLRSVRRRLRSGPAPAPDAATEALDALLMNDDQDIVDAAMEAVASVTADGDDDWDDEDEDEDGYDEDDEDEDEDEEEDDEDGSRRRH